LQATTAHSDLRSTHVWGGASSTFGFTGDQSDPETGFSFLRARVYNPATGRFLSADTVIPNAPGTQGYNLYTYTANNPTTWVDPSGHLTGYTTVVLGNRLRITYALADYQQLGPYIFVLLRIGCVLTWWCEVPLDAYTTLLVGGAGLDKLAGGIGVVFMLVACALDYNCYRTEESYGPSGVSISFGPVNLGCTEDGCFANLDGGGNPPPPGDGGGCRGTGQPLAPLPYSLLAQGEGYPFGGPVTGYTKHGYERLHRRGTTPDDICEAIHNAVPRISIDENGNPSCLYDGTYTEVY